VERSGPSCRSSLGRISRRWLTPVRCRPQIPPESPTDRRAVMPQPAAKQKDKIVATDTHLVEGTPAEVRFEGKLDGKLSKDVLVELEFAAMVDSTATNDPAHAPPPGKAFDKPPTNRGVIVEGSKTVLINNRFAARHGDPATTCNDPEDKKVGKVVAESTVIVGE
jgi:uncharacterized Zn-binding protein involved in type VI secretion